MNFNPAVPLIVGFFVGLISCIYTATWLRRQNSEGVVHTFPHIQRFFIPSIFAVLLGAILHGVGEYQNGGYSLDYKHPDRSVSGQGGFQLIALPLTIGIGALAAAIVGFIFRAVNSFEYRDQYNDKRGLESIPKMKQV